MKHMNKQNIIDALVLRYPMLGNNSTMILQAIDCIARCYKSGNKILVCGNGGSASDALHIVGELMKSFILPRKLEREIEEKIRSKSKNAEYIIKNTQMAIPAISLVNEISLLTAFSNDVASDLNFAQQVIGYGKPGDILIALSTSGNSNNVVYAAEVANALGMSVISLTGKSGGQLKDISGILINVPESDTFKIQELHLPVYHAICMAIETEIFK